jgi:uncharacterized protein YeeX (DUF496 family)
MFSQGSIDEMSVEELAKTIRSMTYSLENRLDDPQDAIHYCYDVINLAHSLHKRLEAVLEDDA